MGIINGLAFFFGCILALIFFTCLVFFVVGIFCPEDERLFPLNKLLMYGGLSFVGACVSILIHATLSDNFEANPVSILAFLIIFPLAATGKGMLEKPEKVDSLEPWQVQVIGILLLGISALGVYIVFGW